MHNAIENKSSVFINCPFDNAYEPFLQAIIFTVFRCGFFPRSAMEEDDASDIRLDKIIRIIKECRFGIHDISRVELDEVNGLPRFNMPFELGLFWGAKRFGETNQSEKNALVFEKKKYDYQKYLSDINGVDIKAHNGKIESIIRYVRNWLAAAMPEAEIVSANKIEKEYLDFIALKLPMMMLEKHTSVQDLTYNDFCAFVKVAIAVKLRQI